MQHQMAGVASMKREMHAGGRMSLRDLGYVDVGLDDYWQECDYGQGKQTFHDDLGNPVVNARRFPDLGAMVQQGHALGLQVGWVPLPARILRTGYSLELENRQVRQNYSLSPIGQELRFVFFHRTTPRARGRPPSELDGKG